MPSTRPASSDPLLASVRARRDAEAREAVGTLVAVLDWTVAHVADRDEQAEPLIGLGGVGCPLIGEWSALDLALTLGGTSDAGLAYLGQALELRHRLPRLFKGVVTLQVPLWKALRVAERTTSLSVEGAASVDRALAPYLHTCSLAQIERAVDAARAAFDPAEADRLRAEAAEKRHATVHLTNASTTGTVSVHADLDLADAIDLEHALRDGAQQLADLGSTETLDVRRSQALGEMARHQPTLDLTTGELTRPDGGRGVTIYAHLADSESAVGLVDNTLTPVLVEQVRQWCQTAGTKVTVKPVIDLAADPVTEAYRPTEAIREQVRLRDHACVFPGCHRRDTDLDHIVPFDDGGQTCPSNLAMLCRRHHRAKTHGDWTYVMLEPGHYQWTSPTGATHLVDRRRRQP